MPLIVLLSLTLTITGEIWKWTFPVITNYGTNYTSLYVTSSLLSRAEIREFETERFYRFRAAGEVGRDT